MARLPTGGFEAPPLGASFTDGQVLPVAGGLRVVHTPGHSPGHVSLLHQPSGLLITGDAIFNVRGLRWPIRAFCTNFALTTRTARRLGELDYSVAAFTHGPEIRDRPREAIRASSPTTRRRAEVSPSPSTATACSDTDLRSRRL